HAGAQPVGIDGENAQRRNVHRFRTDLPTAGKTGPLQRVVGRLVIGGIVDVDGEAQVNDVSESAVGQAKTPLRGSAQEDGALLRLNPGEQRIIDLFLDGRIGSLAGFGDLD